MIQSCRASSGQAGSYWTLRRWPGTSAPARQRVRVPRRAPGGGAPGRLTTRTCSPRRGWAVAAATQMAAVLTLQVLHDFSDGDRRGGPVRCAVKVATGCRWPMRGSTRRRWCWRNRIAKSKRPHRVNDAVRKVIEGPGSGPGGRWTPRSWPMRWTQDTVTQLVSAIRKVAREVPGAADQIAQLHGHDYADRKPKIDWVSPAKELVRAGQRREHPGGSLEGRRLDERGLALALLALVAGQIGPRKALMAGRRWRIARKVAEADHFHVDLGPAHPQVAEAGTAGAPGRRPRPGGGWPAGTAPGRWPPDQAARPARHALKTDPARWLAMSQTRKATGEGRISSADGLATGTGPGTRQPRRAPGTGFFSALLGRNSGSALRRSSALGLRR